MSEENTRQFDIIIFGASGVTGRYVVEEVSISAGKNSIKWAIAGRNIRKLKETLSQVQEYLDDGIDIQNIPIIYADAQEPSSLHNMCKSAKLVLHCVGPYTLYGGELIVATCIEYGTHYIDLSAELKYLETVQAKYFTLARKKGCTS